MENAFWTRCATFGKYFVICWLGLFILSCTVLLIYFLYLSKSEKANKGNRRSILACIVFDVLSIIGLILVI